MYALLLRIVLIVAALLFLCQGGSARPNMALHRAAHDVAAADSITVPKMQLRHFRPECLLKLCRMCDAPAEDATTAWMSSMIGRELGHDYYVGLTAGRAWRPLQNFGDCDNKLRVYNPTIGVMVKYRF